MKFALLSDIHGNSFALEAVLNAVKKKSINTLIITGDFIGYYYWPVEVFDLLSSWHVIAIRGNHDRMLEFSNNKDYRLKIRKKYGSGLDIAYEQLDRNTIEWLMDLPDKYEFKVNKDNKLLLCHGSPWDGDEYVYPNANDKSLNRYATLNVKWVVQGHTHYPMYEENGDVILINPGSIGQPRNSQTGAQWAQLDTNTNKVDFFCEQYDIKYVVQEAKKRDPEIAYLSNILQKT